MENARVDANPDSIAVLLALAGRIDTLGKTGCAKLMLLDHPPAIKAPGYNRMVIRLDGKQIVDIAALGQHHQKTIKVNQK